MYITTSWDDGHILDRKLVSLLNKYNVKGTFFLAKNFSQEQLLEEDIINISKNHEIGAHTINHPFLSKLDYDEQYKEIYESKVWLENILKEECQGFCYPSGDYNTISLDVVERCKFLYSRTVEPNRFDISKNKPYEVPTSLHIYPYPFRKINEDQYLWNDLFRPLINNKRLYAYSGFWGLCKFSWSSMAISLFKKTYKNKEEVFHLWGHSWEIEKYGMWEELEKFLEYVSSYSDVKFVTNKELVLEIR